MHTNVLSASPPTLADLFGLLAQPNRLYILLVMAHGEACVCHLEAALGMRQAAISQHLMALRNAGLVVHQRHGRNIFYRLANPALFDALCQVAAALGLPAEELEQMATLPIAGCCCPHCNPLLDPDLACKKTTPVSTP